MAVKLQPLADRLVVKPIEAEEKTKAGIYLPDTAKEKPHPMTASASPWTSKLVTSLSMPNTAAPKSKLTTKSI